MPPKRYVEKLSYAEILSLCQPIPDGNYEEEVTKPYAVGLNDGIVYRITNSGIQPLFTFRCKKHSHIYVRLFRYGKSKAIAVHRLVWLAGTGSPIPEGWEIHHRDGVTSHNWFDNLFCLHPVDHRKLHSRGLLEDPTPF